jgi:hypothetical protein
MSTQPRNALIGRDGSPAGGRAATGPGLWGEGEALLSRRGLHRGGLRSRFRERGGAFLQPWSHGRTKFGGVIHYAPQRVSVAGRADPQIRERPRGVGGREDNQLIVVIPPPANACRRLFRLILGARLARWLIDECEASVPPTGSSRSSEMLSSAASSSRPSSLPCSRPGSCGIPPTSRYEPRSSAWSMRTTRTFRPCTHRTRTFQRCSGPTTVR